MQLLQTLTLNLNPNDKIAIYGIGSETKRILNEENINFQIVGLLDSFQDSGEIYGYNIISINEVIKENVKLIIVIARPGSCMAITKKIGKLCEKNNILLYDIRGNNLLEKRNTIYEFPNDLIQDEDELIKKINEADVISFDIFDTLITRKITEEFDIFELINIKLEEQGIFIPNFAKLRLAVEKKLSRNGAPKLYEIYDEMLKQIGGVFITALELCELEKSIDFSLCVLRKEMLNIFNYAKKQHKTITITTDTYYSEDNIKKLLDKFEICNYDKLFVSSEYNTSKTQDLFDYLCKNYKNKSILHIGNDEAADIIPAEKRKIKTYRIYGNIEMFNILNCMGIEKNINTISDKIKLGLFVSHFFNNPFIVNRKKLNINDSYSLGYLLFAPIITDFVIWLKEKCKTLNINQMLFLARDGYFIGRLYRKIDKNSKSIYFLTSRIAAIRAGIRSEKDIDYVESMKYSGSEDESFYTRFNIDANVKNKKTMALEMAKIKSQNYLKYIKKFSLNSETIGVFDFVAKGTVQYFLQNLFSEHLKGFYFLRQEIESMSDKNLDIDSFFSEEEKNTSEIFKNYYILETILTSPYPSVKDFTEEGNPIFDEETRDELSLKYINEAGQGIEDYFNDYINLIPDKERVINKKLSENILSLINKVNISDEKFLSLKVEDPFFGRYTDIKAIM